MILTEDIVHQIAGGKRTMIRLPIKGKCPVREGHVYEIKTARDRPVSCHITVASVKEAWMDERRVWTIRFQKGDHSDKPRLLAAKPGLPHGDYTDAPVMSLKTGAEEVGASTHGRYARESEEGLRVARNGVYDDYLARLGAVVREIREFAVEPRANENLRGIERQVRSLQRKLTAQ